MKSFLNKNIFSWAIHKKDEHVTGISISGAHDMKHLYQLHYTYKYPAMSSNVHDVSWNENTMSTEHN